MNTHVDTVTYAATLLEELVDELVLVGGCAPGFLVTDANEVTFRSTKDVDVVTTATKVHEYHKIESRLRELGFQPVAEVYCRHRKDGLIIDVMPVDTQALGAVNPWYAEGVKLASSYPLSTTAKIRVIHPILFIASKVEAFNHRGDGSFMASHDIEDIVTVVSGRKEINDELFEVSELAREFVGSEIETLLGDPSFTNSLPGLIGASASGNSRQEIVIERLSRLANL